MLPTALAMITVLLTAPPSLSSSLAGASVAVGKGLDDVRVEDADDAVVVSVALVVVAVGDVVVVSVSLLVVSSEEEDLAVETVVVELSGSDVKVPRVVGADNATESSVNTASMLVKSMDGRPEAVATTVAATSDAEPQPNW